MIWIGVLRLSLRMIRCGWLGGGEGGEERGITKIGLR